MNDPQVADGNILTYILAGLGGLLSIGSAAVAQLHIRSNKIEDRIRLEILDAKKEAIAGDSALWTAFNEERMSLRGFREKVLETMLTKDDMAAMKSDLAAMEQRLVATLRQTREPTT